MRTAFASLAFTVVASATVVASVALAESPQAAAIRSYRLQGYYELDKNPVWKLSDSAPWVIESDAPWANPRLLKWGYRPVTHDDKHYYCLIDTKPRTGSHVIEDTFTCGDPNTAQWLFNTYKRPTLLLHGDLH